jgi:hypothetical protein
MAYTPHQKRVARKIYRRGRKMKVSHKEMIAALETGLVEANLGNPRGGEGTSSGWRQETTSSYPNVNRRDVDAAAKRFFSETRTHRRRGQTAGQLAQAVQRSAYPSRYDQRKGQAKDLQQWLKKEYKRGGGGGEPGTRTTTKRTPGINRSPERQALKLQYLQNRNNPSALLSLAQGLGEAQDVPGKVIRKTTRVKRGGGRRGDEARPGGGYMGTERLARGAAKGLPVSSLKRDRKNTSSGGISDHWVGKKNAYAVDIAAAGSYGDKVLEKVARRLGVRPVAGSYARQTIKRGGKKYSVQLLWKVEGHHDHVHVGITRI